MMSGSPMGSEITFQKIGVPGSWTHTTFGNIKRLLNLTDEEEIFLAIRLLKMGFARVGDYQFALKK